MMSWRVMREDFLEQVCCGRDSISDSRRGKLVGVICHRAIGIRGFCSPRGLVKTAFLRHPFCFHTIKYVVAPQLWNETAQTRSTLENLFET